MSQKDLIAKYDIAAPRYTSYPTVPYWDSVIPGQEQWKKNVREAWLRGGKKISLYIHLPFCESLCTYCACNTRITTNHGVEQPYLENLQKEWMMYVNAIGEKPRINELHLGGGTPTFFSAEHLGNMMRSLMDHADFDANAIQSFEAHPANTTADHLETLHRFGFRRLSLGIQDFNPLVQRLIHRMQSEEQVKAVTNLARIIGYRSVNFDLIYGLPKQTTESISDTVKKVAIIRPDRIAFYSYAHVPWMRPGQRAYTEKDLPTGAEKRELYETGRAILEMNGYVEIGLDHFALPGDELLNASLTGKLHRNFMGYTEQDSPLLIGMGVSAISDSGTMLVQNEKTLEEWNERIAKNQLPIFRGHELTADDMIIRHHILNIMCKGETYWTNKSEQFSSLAEVVDRMKEMEKDGLIQIKSSGVKVLPAGKPFLRNLGLCFDLRFHSSKPGMRIFSQAV